MTKAEIRRDNDILILRYSLIIAESDLAHRRIVQMKVDELIAYNKKVAIQIAIHHLNDLLEERKRDLKVIEPNSVTHALWNLKISILYQQIGDLLVIQSELEAPADIDQAMEGRPVDTEEEHFGPEIPTDFDRWGDPKTADGKDPLP